MTPPASFDKLRVVAFESRRAEETARMIERFGGTPLVSPALREAPLEDDESVIEFGHRLITGQIDVVILLTGVGARETLARIERRIERQRFLDALADVKTVVRGPKPLAVLKEWGIAPTLTVPEPNTWREVLATIDARLPIANLHVAVQEYGEPNVSLVAGLEARGAVVETYKGYRWALPEDVGPLRENVQRLAAGEVDVVMFTSAQQIVHVLEMAGQAGVPRRGRLGGTDDQREAAGVRVAGGLRTVAPQVGASGERSGGQRARAARAQAGDHHGACRLAAVAAAGECLASRLAR
ncbi:MAG TPA: uroporphyrinogen-III synthase [Lacipirellulaceae bacterium]|nr:uroporphyrinogen-III synthase [Lacipirellulaceae bacterium]